MRSMEPDADSSGKNLAIHFLTRGWRSIWLRLNGFHRRNDHVPGAIFLKWEAGPWRGYSPTWSVTRAMVTRATSFGTGATMSGKVSWSGTALLVAAKFMLVQVVRIYWGFATPERYPRELMTLFWLSFWMMTTIRLSPVRVALSQGIEDSASAGTDWTHWWKEARVTFVSAENRAQ